MSAALPGVAAAHTDLPVIGVPIVGKNLGGLDALLSAVQMPPGRAGRLRCDRRRQERRPARGAHHQLKRVIARYTRARRSAPSGRDERRMGAWLEVELAATDAWAAEGVVPAEAAAACRERAAFTVEAVKERERDDRPRRRRVRRRRRRLDRRGGPLDPLRAHLLRRARHRARPAAARGGRDRRRRRHAPTATRWSSARASTATRSASGAPTASTPSRPPSACGSRASPSRPTATSSGCERAFEQAAVGKLSGAVGTYASVPPAVEARVMECARPARRGHLDPGRPPRPPRRRSSPRSRSPAPGSSASRTEVRNLQRTEVREVEEPFGAGSRRARRRCRTSATRSLAERITGLARVLRGYAQAGFENVALWHERDISHSGAERVILPDATILLDYMQHLARADRRAG